MPVKPEREYRTLLIPLLMVDKEKRFDTDYYIEGYAATWDKYPLYEDKNGIVYEQFLPEAFLGTDMSDVIMQYNHTGRVFARNSNGTLIVEPDDKGLFIAADLKSTEGSRNLFEDISTGLITKMSWGFLPDNNSIEYNRATNTIIHHKIKKIFDVSAVSIPANEGTEIYARSEGNGVIAGWAEECRARAKQIQKIKLMMEV